MKFTFKTVCVSAIFVATIGLLGVHSGHNSTTTNTLALSNIEALTATEEGCNYSNGYKSWKSERPWWWSDTKEFYDCCQKLREGYSPEGNCN